MALKKPTSGLMKLDLFGPGMTGIHRIGLAGLWMTLDYFEKGPRQIKEAVMKHGTWTKDATTITMEWRDTKFFDDLIAHSFKIDKNNIIWLTALGEPIAFKGHATLLHEAMMGTFLQHGQTRKADKSDKPGGNITLEIDDHKITVKFQRVYSYSHQTAAFDPQAIKDVAGWMYPGAAVRHVGLGQSTTAMKETPERTLSLRYTPIGAIFFRVKRLGTSHKYAMVIPDINNLQAYGEIRRHFIKCGVHEFFAAGSSDAGYKVLAELEASGFLKDIRQPSCTVVSFGVVPWNKQQKSRMNIMKVRVDSAERLRFFKLCNAVNPARLIKTEKNPEPFWDVPQITQLVADNLVNNREWWEDFSTFIGDSKVCRHIFSYERGGLIKMVEFKGSMKDAEKLFVSACHEAWRRRLGALGDRAKREKLSFGDLVSREFEKTRVSAQRCKNAATIREVVSDFWSRAGGPLKSLQSGWQDATSFFDETQWKKARDLFLISLASYKPASKDEEKAFEQKTEVSELQEEEQ